MPRNQHHTLGICPTCGNTIEPGYYKNNMASYCDDVCRKAWHQGVRFEPWVDDLMDGEVDPVITEQEVIAAEAADELHNAIDALPHAWRQVVEARFFSGMTRPDTAAALGISTALVAYREDVAAKRLRAAIHR